MRYEDEIFSLLKKFKNNGICHDSSKPARLQQVLNYQDYIGRNTLEDTTEFCLGLDDSLRRIFFWANNSCLSIDLSLEIMQKYLIKKLGLPEYIPAQTGHTLQAVGLYNF